MRVVKNLSPQNLPIKWNTPLSNYACAIRPVAAIMVTKIHGFSTLVESDYQQGLQLLDNSYQLHDYYAKQFGCVRMVKMGDMVLTAFSSAEQAMNCAFKVERGARKMFNHKLRIGIHMGEVRLVDGDLFGGPINIAEDLLSIAGPGEVLVSESIARGISSVKWTMEARGNIGPAAIPAYTIKNKRTGHLFSDWHDQGSGLSSDLVLVESQK